MADSRTLKELAALVEGEVVGDNTLKVSGLNSLELADTHEITFVTGSKMVASLKETRAAACIAPIDIDAADLPLIKVRNPEYAAAVIHNHFLSRPFNARGIDPAARIGRECRIAEEVTIGPYVVIGDWVHIGERVHIHPGTVIGDECQLGDDTLVYPNVTIARGSIIGQRVILHSGVVIGSDGFGFATDPATGSHLKKPQVGNVQIDDDVEIGANSCVDRAAFGTTRVRSGVKIDNLVMVAHNVDVGENSILVSQVGIAGSTTLGRNVVLGGASGVAGHLHISDGVMVAGMSGVHNNLKEGAIVGGYPAIDAKQWGRACAVFNRLPEIQKEVRRLRKEVERLSQFVPPQAGNSEQSREDE